jgi:hypothetical protein
MLLELGHSSEGADVGGIVEFGRNLALFWRGNVAQSGGQPRTGVARDSRRERWGWSDLSYRSRLRPRSGDVRRVGLYWCVLAEPDVLDSVLYLAGLALEILEETENFLAVGSISSDLEVCEDGFEEWRPLLVWHGLALASRLGGLAMGDQLPDLIADDDVLFQVVVDPPPGFRPADSRTAHRGSWG